MFPRPTTQSKHTLHHDSRGVVALFLVVMVLAVASILSLSLSLVYLNRIKSFEAFGKSQQAYFASEGGTEDAVYRIKNNFAIPASYTLAVGGAQTDVTTTTNGNQKTIQARGMVNGYTRATQASLTLSSVNPSFYYGAQVGGGGIEMGENSTIEGAEGSAGNVYSNGAVSGENKAKVTGDLIVATSIDSVVVLGDAKANAIINSKICGDAYYQSIDSSSLNFLNSPSSPSCPSPPTNGVAYPGSSDPPVQNLPISQANIDQWKQDGAVGGIINGNCGDSGVPECVINDDGTLSLGPKKIIGNLVLTKKQTLVITGTLYVQGHIDLDSSGGATIKCDQAYGAQGCVVVTDSWIHIKNNSIFQGSGAQGSYLIFVSTLAGCNGGDQEPQCTHHNAAVDIHNNATGAIFYVPDSMANLHNGVTVTELTAYKLNLDNGASVQYEQGLFDSSFSSGPGASFNIIGWEEIP
ncbi:MAG: hypothetical protein HYV65_00985 [Candidatus Spechtbacteria bacterium]|nr:hypothetical protein [Candidatus Spechtbacteria bacterium]